MNLKRVFLPAAVLLGAAAWPLFAGEVIEMVAGVEFRSPESWIKTEPSSVMRILQFRVPGPENAGEAEVAVFHFGPGRGGSVEDNIERWHQQFGAGATPPDSRVATHEVNGMKVTTVHVEGTYDGGMAPGAVPASAHALLGAIVEGPQGAVFFKMTGPQAAVRDAAGSFRDLVNSFRPSQFRPPV